MAINIKSERACELARRAAQATGRSQVSVIEEALERYLKEFDADSSRRQDRVEQILNVVDRELTFVERERIRAAEAELYDDAGVPR